MSLLSAFVVFVFGFVFDALSGQVPGCLPITGRTSRMWDTQIPLSGPGETVVSQINQAATLGPTSLFCFPSGIFHNIHGIMAVNAAYA